MSRRADGASSPSRYFSEIGEYPLLTREQEMEIARAARAPGQRGAAADLNRLVESNLSFVVRIASQHRNMGLPLEDLVSEGNIGLIEAARRYDHTKGVKFITYAVWWVRKSILDALSRQSFLVRVPSYRLKKVRRIREAEASLSRELGRPPDREEISSRLECAVFKIDESLRSRHVEISLDDDTGREGLKAGCSLVDHNSVNPEEGLLKAESRDLLRCAVRALSEQERIVIARRFGMQRDRSFTLKEIGEMLGLSRERIRQIEAQAKKKLRRILEELSWPARGGAGGRARAAAPDRDVTSARFPPPPRRPAPEKRTQVTRSAAGTRRRPPA